MSGAFSGQRCYGYLSFEAFVDAATACNAGDATPKDYDGVLPTLSTTAGLTSTSTLHPPSSLPLIPQPTAAINVILLLTLPLALPLALPTPRPTSRPTPGATAILEAGRRSLDANGRPFELIYKDDTSETPTDIRPVTFA